MQINLLESNNYIHNLAYIKALLIKEYIEQLHVCYEEKELLKKDILEYLKNVAKPL